MERQRCGNRLSDHGTAIVAAGLDRLELMGAHEVQHRFGCGTVAESHFSALWTKFLIIDAQEIKING